MSSSLLKDVLTKEGIKQALFARTAGVSVGLINRVCNGKIMPAATTQNRIVKKLNEMSGGHYSSSDIFPVVRKTHN